MKTNPSPSARLQTGLLITAAGLGLLAVALVLPLRAASAMPSTPPAAPAGQTSTPGPTMPAGGMMGGDMMNNMGAMMKNMGSMMDKMGGMMSSGQMPAKADAMPMADMDKMGRMMNGMGAMMGAMGGGSDKAGAAPAMAMGCSCCEKMMSGMSMMGGPGAMAKTPSDQPAAQAGEATPAPAAGSTATDHAAHH